MKKISIINRFFGLMIFSLLILIGVWGCRKETLVYNTTSDVNITSYLDKNPGTFSEFRKILDITGNASYLNAYGAYTLFAPTNAAIDLYLKNLGKTSVDQVDVNVLKDMVRFHLLSDTIRSNQFTDGKLPSLTMYGQYLITGASNVGGVTKTVINRQANIVKSDIMVGNGIIHSIDAVLIPAQYSVAKLIENNPKYTIFTQALKETGLYDTLNILPANNPIISRQFLTCLAESDSVLNVAGFSTYAALKAKLCKTGDPKNTTDSLYLFMAYHIIPGAKYLADIASSQVQTTLAPLEILSSSLVGTTILINDIMFMGVHEPGATINRSTSDNSATNGVVHSLMQHITLKIRYPSRIDWFVSDIPELRKMTAVFRINGKGASWDESSGASPLSTITWQVTKMVFGPAYMCSTTDTHTNYAPYNEMFYFPLGAPNRPTYIEFITPVVVRGKYKVWANYRYISGGVRNQVLIDGIPMQKLLEFGVQRPSGADAVLEAQGWKQFTANTSTYFSGRLLGTIDIQTTSTHVFRIQNISGTGANQYLNMVQFIPIANDQVYPRFNTDGSLIPHP